MPIKVTLQTELNRIQKELQAPKGQFNKFGNYKYRSCEDILEALKKVLGDCSVVITDEIVQIGERYYVKATAGLLLGDEEVKVSALAREAFQKKGMDEAQITGSASSYARKYALNGLFAIDDTKDADTQDNSKADYRHSTSDVPTKKIYATQAQIGRLTKMTAQVPGSQDKIKEHFHVGTLTDLSVSQASQAISKLNKKIETGNLPDSVQ